MICSKKIIPKTKNREEFIKKFLEIRPATYNKDNTLQSDSNKNRSFSELLLIVRERFPVTSIKAVIRIVSKLGQEGRCYVVWCTQINKFVIKSGFKKSPQPFISNYTKKYYKEKKGVDNISFSLLEEIEKQVKN